MQFSGCDNSAVVGFYTVYYTVKQSVTMFLPMNQEKNNRKLHFFTFFTEKHYNRLSSQVFSRTSDWVVAKLTSIAVKYAT